MVILDKLHTRDDMIINRAI